MNSKAVCLLLLFLARIAAAGDSAATLESPAMRLRFARDGARYRLIEVVNKLSQRAIPVSADDFSIELQGRAPLTAADFQFVRDLTEPTPDGQRLRLQFESATNGLGLEVIYELGKPDFVARRRLELTTARPLPLRNLEVWHAGVQGTCPLQEDEPPFYLAACDEWKVKGRKGFGLPLFLEDTFWGLESPTGYNRYESGVVSLWQHPGQTVTNRFVSKTAVLGVAGPQQVARQFQRYVESFRARPFVPLVLGFNTWYMFGGNPSEKGCIEAIELLRRKMYEPYGISPDVFIVDDGWDKKDSLWDINTGRFPNGFAPLVAALAPMNMRLGLWMCPSSGYDHGGWCAQHGYAANANWSRFICQSDPGYRRDMVARFGTYRERYDIGYFKLDSFMLTCDTDRHPWHLPGDFACEANAEAFEELLRAMRGNGEPVFLNPTCGMWCSPWWLRSVDALWPDLFDGDAPSAAPAPDFPESSLTSRDAQFRLRCQQNPWFPPGAMDTLEFGRVDGLPGKNQIMATIARGQRFVNFVTDLRRLSDEDWRFVAEAFRWAKHNALTLSRTELLPGDPMKGEPYGLAHFRDGRGILSLRNPAIQPQKMRIKLDEMNGMFTARVVYPRRETLHAAQKGGDTLEVELQAFEQMIVELGPGDNRCPAPVLVGRHETSAVALEGTFPDFRATVTGKARSSFILLCRAGTDLTGPLQCTATVNGAPAKLRVSVPNHNPPHRLFYRELNRQYWKWFQFDLPPGPDHVTLTLSPPASKDMEMSAWIWTEEKP